VTALRACSLVVLLLSSLPAYAGGSYAATTKAECVAEVELVRVSGRGQSLEYAVSIRHDAPTGVASVKWKYSIDFLGDDGAPHTFAGNAGLASAKSSQTLRSRAPNGTQVPIRTITGHKVTDTTCSYSRSAK
jgi:hypothetical protein